TADQAGDENFLPAPQVTQTFFIGKCPVKQIPSAPASASVGESVNVAAALETLDACNPAYTGTISLDFGDGSSASGPGGAISTNHTYAAAGMYTIAAGYDGDTLAAGQPLFTVGTTTSITINKLDQTVDFTSGAPGSASVGGATYTPAASATSSLAVTI